jgi:hypothetical protein
MADSAMAISTVNCSPMSTTANLEQAPVVLTVLNRRRDGAASQLVLFKMNSAAAANPVLAWKVLRCAAGRPARVVVPFSQQVGVFNPRGAHAGLESASAGECFQVADRATVSGAAAPLLSRGQRAAIGPNMVGVHNGTSDGVLDVVLYKDGRPLYREAALAPGGTMVFEVLPYLHAALCTGVAEGAVLDAATVAAATRISLLGLKSADLILTGAAGEEKIKLVNPRFS